MKIRLFIILFIGLNSPASGAVMSYGQNSIEARLQTADAVAALAIANQLKWTNGAIRSYATSREVVFKLPEGKVKKILLPEEKMMVAVAPYFKKTHT